MGALKRATHILASRLRCWLGFELLFQLVVLSLVGPCLKLALDGAMALSGYAYLTWENVRAFALTPACIVMALVLAVLLALVALFEAAGLHYAFACDDAGDKPRVRDAVRYALARTLSAFRPANLPVIPYILVLLPFVGIGPTAGVVRGLNVPEFIMEYIEMNMVFAVAYLVVFVVLAVVASFFVFSIVFFAGEDDTFVNAARKARAAGKHHVVRDVLTLILAAFLIWVVTTALGFALAAPALAVGDGLLLWRGAARMLVAVLGLILTVPVTYATCLALLQSREGMAPAAPVAPKAHMKPLAASAVIGAVALASVAGSVYFSYNNFVLPAQQLTQSATRHVDLTAHRGGTFGGPENTMAAFRMAALDGADICELDVQQSADGVIFVSHDSNFERISGVDKGAWELTWAEICELDATGSYWEGVATPQKYPTLDEVVAWADEKGMRLNIELKPTGHETDFEQAVVDVINAHDFGDRCIVTSQAYDTVARMKQLAPEATCTYVMTLAYGDICQLDAADAFSMEETSVTPAMTAYLHANGKQVLAWVVNSEPSMWRAIGNGADNIITDDVPLAREVVDEANEQPPAARLLYSISALLA